MSRTELHPGLHDVPCVIPVCRYCTFPFLSQLNVSPLPNFAPCLLSTRKVALTLFLLPNSVRKIGLEFFCKNPPLLCSYSIMQWLAWIILPFVFTVAWLYTASVTKTKFPQLRNKRICLLIAHPDDEAMFFAPALLALTQPDLGNHVKILCLSSGECWKTWRRACADSLEGMQMVWGRRGRRN